MTTPNNKLIRVSDQAWSVLKQAQEVKQPFQPKDIGAKSSDQTSRNLLLLEKYGYIKKFPHPIHRCWYLYERTELGMKALVHHVRSKSSGDSGEVL